MREDTRRAVETFWCDVFAVAKDQLWRQVSVQHPHARLGGYEGWYVAWRGEGVHVSAPASADVAEVARLRARSVVELQDPLFWGDLADRLSLQLVGPSRHHYLDEDPGVPDLGSGIEQVEPVRLTLLRARTSAEEWEESGIPDALEEGGEALAVWGPGDPGRPWVPALLGGAVLTETAGARRDIGLLVAQDARGRGLGVGLGRAAASYAIAWHGWARWTCRTTNETSLRTAARLGFEPYATQLTLRPAG